MKKITTAVAYPTIPIIFLGGINADRKPIYDTMGLAVTDINEITRTETTITELHDQIANQKPVIKLFLGKKEISGKRGKQIISAIKLLMEKNNLTRNLKIVSNNYQIFSGSSDSGLAALFVALDDFLELKQTKKEILNYSMKGSESAGRSLYGGLTHTKVSPFLEVEQLASDEELKSIKLLAVPFNYENRFSADEIHTGIIMHPKFQERVETIPLWVDRIKTALVKKDYIELLTTAEENIRNAHELLEEVGIVVRKPEMMQLCNELKEMNEKKIPAYYLIGGGNLVTIATTEEYFSQVINYLSLKNWQFYKYKIAGAPKIIISD